ncbi:hypothetical protein MKW98_025878 [Papaver atlanticum]|uniref:Epidermal patterning factor-like protein n=1 Tax=Papaver atlanticum TaxID=357466 RepID=A0AAD4X2Z3_9MAGN|nr:hypothetical protein MKW98_025878 [Papaver atlanticum]
MKNSFSLSIMLVLTILILAPSIMSARRVGRSRSHHSHLNQDLTHQEMKDGVTVKRDVYSSQERKRMPVMRRPKPDTLQIAGSSLPDCSHACGSCTPCRLVMVSFVCESLDEAETCPMAYKCMCHSRSYPVP